MQRTTARKLDSIICVIKSLLGGMFFGFWQHSFLAGAFMLILLTAVLNIGWAVEYGDMGYDEDSRP